MWAEDRFPETQVAVVGVQHFSRSASKNSADIAIAARAMADLIAGRTTHAVALSNDSDLMSLYAAVREEPEIPRAGDYMTLLSGRVA